MSRSLVRRSRRQVLGMGAGALGAAVFAACARAGKDGESGGESQAATRTIPLLNSAAAGERTPGGVLRLGAIGEEGRDALLGALIYSRLVAVDPRTALVYADLAQSLEMPDPLTVVFRLRPELRFHPDAQGLAAALTAEDVRRDLKGRTGNREYLFNEVVDRVDAPDQGTVLLRLRGPFSQLFESLGDPAAGSVRSVQRSGVTGKPLGSGPFIPAARDAGGDVLARNQLHHRSGLPLLDGVAVLQFSDERELAGAFARGDLDVGMPAEDVTGEDASAHREAEVPERPTFGLLGLGLSLLPEKGGRTVRFTPAFQDERVRRAIAVALDRQAIQERFGGTLSGPVGPAHGADALPEAELAAHPLYRHDPAEARALLEAAGHSQLAFRLQAPARPVPRALAQLLLEQLGQAGLSPHLQLVESGEWKRSFRAGDFEATVFELEGLRTPDLGLRLHTSVGVEGDFSPWGYSSPVYDEAVRGVLAEIDPVLRAERSRRAQRLLLDDVPAMLPLFAPLERVSVAVRVRGYEYAAYGFNESWLAAQWDVAVGRGN